MADQVRWRRGSTAENNAFTGASGEITVDVDSKTLRLHDGVTAGGTSLVTAPQLAALASIRREVLTAARTYYVRLDGSDSNTGLADTAGGAFRTIQKAIDVVASLDISIHSVIVSVQSGLTTTSTLTLKDPVGSGAVSLVGDDSTPSNCPITVTGTKFQASGSRAWIVSGFSLSGAGHGMLAMNGGQIKFHSCNFGDCGSAHAHIYAINFGFIEATNAYSISGAAQIHMRAAGSIVSVVLRTVTLTGTPAFSSRFAFAERGGLITCNANTYSGAATGQRYLANTNGIIYTNGGGASYLPGDTAGAVATGGVYV